MSPIISGPSAAAAKISGVTVTGTAAAGDVPVASSSSAGVWQLPPAYEFGYDQITAGVNVTGTSAATANAIITCAAHTFDGNPVILVFFSPEVACSTTAASTMGISLWESGAPIGDLGFIRTDITASQDLKPVFLSYRFTPTAASHTYTIAAYTSSTTGTPSIQAGSGGSGVNLPAFARFIKV